jgi:hypothetical protein
MMSIYIQQDDEPDEQIGSIRGYGNFARWVRTLSSAPNLLELVDTGESKETAKVAAELACAIPKAHGDVLTSAQGILAIISRHPPAITLTVTNGM